MKRGLLVVMTIALTVMGFCFGVGFAQATMEPEVIEVIVEKLVVVEKPVVYEVLPSELVELALAGIEAARATHQYFVDHPELVSEEVGSVEHHRAWVQFYDYNECLIRELVNNENKLREGNAPLLTR